MTSEEVAFNIEGSTFFNMLDGMSYEEAHAEAIKEFKEMQRLFRIEDQKGGAN